MQRCQVKHTIELGPSDVIDMVKREMNRQGYEVKGQPQLVCTLVDEDYHGRSDVKLPAFQCVRVDVERTPVRSPSDKD